MKEVYKTITKSATIGIRPLHVPSRHQSELMCITKDQLTGAEDGEWLIEKEIDHDGGLYTREGEGGVLIVDSQDGFPIYGQWLNKHTI